MGIVWFILVPQMHRALGSAPSLRAWESACSSDIYFFSLSLPLAAGSGGRDPGGQQGGGHSCAAAVDRARLLQRSDSPGSRRLHVQYFCYFSVLIATYVSGVCVLRGRKTANARVALCPTEKSVCMLCVCVCMHTKLVPHEVDQAGLSSLTGVRGREKGEEGADAAARHGQPAAPAHGGPCLPPHGRPTQIVCPKSVPRLF